MLKPFLIGAAAMLALGSATLAGTTPAAADSQWCARTASAGDARICQFTTLQQCQAYVSGLAGACEQNFAYVPGRQQPRRRSFVSTLFPLPF